MGGLRLGALPVTGEVSQHIAESASEAALGEAAQRVGCQTMRREGDMAWEDGVVSEREIARAIGGLG